MLSGPRRAASPTASGYGRIAVAKLSIGAEGALTCRLPGNAINIRAQ
jgi:hypothetical protein